MLPDKVTRWTASRKAGLIAAIRSGHITFEAACRRYDISAEELLGQQWLLDRYGPGALQATTLGEYRGRRG